MGVAGINGIFSRAIDSGIPPNTALSAINTGLNNALAPDPKTGEPAPIGQIMKMADIVSEFSNATLETEMAPYGESALNELKNSAQGPLASYISSNISDVQGAVDAVLSGKPMGDIMKEYPSLDTDFLNHLVRALSMSTQSTDPATVKNLLLSGSEEEIAKNIAGVLADGW